MKTTMEHLKHEEIANLARQMWEWEGRQCGRDLEYWLRAERQLAARRSEQTHSGRESAASAMGSSHGKGRPIRLPESVTGGAVR